MRSRTHRTEKAASSNLPVPGSRFLDSQFTIYALTSAIKATSTLAPSGNSLAPTANRA